jgi:GNAT superfamily N-acetyltransferase
LGEVSKTLKVIYFDYGLKPVIKHGEHDQSEHGNWATGRSEEDVERISRMKDRGPSIEELDKAMSGGDSAIDPDKAEFMIDNDSFLNMEIEDRINTLMTANEELSGKPMSEEERLANYDDYRRQVTEEYIDENPDYLEEFARENGYGSLKDPEVSEALKESFQDVYGVEITSDRQGDPITLRSEVEEVYVDGDGIHVKSVVYDDGGDVVSTESIHRVFSKDENSGTWSVEHKLLEIEADYRGLGFGGKFLQQSEDWYIAKGVTHIVLNAGLEDGARHWANAGFDWNRDELSFIASQLDDQIASAERRVETGNSGLMGVSATKFGQDLQEAKVLLGRMRDSEGNIKDMRNDDFPKPADFARLGAKSPLVTADGDSTWTGKELLRGMYTPYVKVLTAEGSKILDGPIDMDGDGLIYDGTPREKPVSGG